jgi:hypothetical protein
MNAPGVGCDCVYFAVVFWSKSTVLPVKCDKLSQNYRFAMDTSIIITSRVPSADFL